MSIASEITRLQGCKSDIRTALVNKGVSGASSHNMADFAADITSIAAGGATITVTYNSSFYNKTMTCTNGVTTYTKTTTSSGSTTFSVTEGGTWTISCNGTSRTVNVVLSYSVQMAITKTITIHGAKEDYITFTDATGSKVCQFASGATSKSVSITFVPNQSITFTSTVAKNLDNLSQNYSKSITLTDSTSSIVVRPDTAVYWYGWTDNTFTGAQSAGCGLPSYPTYDAQFRTNDIWCQSNANNNIYGIGNSSAIAAGKKLTVISDSRAGYSQYYIGTTKGSYNMGTGAISSDKWTTTAFANNAYALLCAIHAGSTVSIKALLIE